MIFSGKAWKWAGVISQVRSRQNTTAPGHDLVGELNCKSLFVGFLRGSPFRKVATFVGQCRRLEKNKNGSPGSWHGVGLFCCLQVFTDCSMCLK